MLSKNQEKLIRSLRLPKFRKEHQKFVAETPKVVLDLLSSRFCVTDLFYTKTFLDVHRDHLPDTCRVMEVTEKELEKISGLKTPQEVLAIVDIPEMPVIDMGSFSGLALYLDDIRDPGNMGTIIRSADWFGLDAVFCSVNCVDVFNPKVVQATMGSVARTPVVYVDPVIFFSSLPKGFPVYGCVAEGEALYNAQLTPHGLIVIGNEAHGIGKTAMPYITQTIGIPSFGHERERAESLNAAIAASVVCAEFRRRFG